MAALASSADSPSFSAASRRSAYRGMVAVIDDEENMPKILTRILNVEGYHVATFKDPVAALEAIEKEPPDVALTDMRMPRMTGDVVLRRIQEIDSDIPVVIITAFGSIQGAVEALKRGAFDYITKPFQMDDILLTVARAMENRRLRQENRLMSDALGGAAAGAVELLGDSPEFREVRRLIQKVAPSESPVLITGESGTGKELVARAIHRGSPRAGGRFVPINCASIPENLLESELFGYERGAFTGASRAKLGLMELASGGTLFLDEIGDLPVALQAKLLRSLQEREIQRVGGLRVIPVDLRLIAATNRDLQRAIADERFRQDLFYRLNVISIHLPPLRHRLEDIELLARHFLRRHERKRGAPLRLTPAALGRLRRYRWPGNVRELENVIERTAVLLDGDVVDESDLPPELLAAPGAPPTPAPTAPPAPDAPLPLPPAVNGAAGESEELIARTVSEWLSQNLDFREARDRFEREFLAQSLRRAGGAVSEAARRAGMSRRNLYEKIEKLKIPLDQIKEEERPSAQEESASGEPESLQ